MSTSTEAATQSAARAVEHDRDDAIRLHGVSFEQYETILAIRGDRAGVRIAWLDGELELMSPSRSHEHYAKMIGRLLEAFAEERGLSLNGYGSWTIKGTRPESGAEPDECYILGDPHVERDHPDFAIEVDWTHASLDKLEIYRRRRVPEVWYWRKERIAIYRLGSEGYEQVERSILLPDLDPALLARFADRRDQTEAVIEWRRLIRGPRAASAE